MEVEAVKPGIKRRASLGLGLQVQTVKAIEKKMKIGIWNVQDFGSGPSGMWAVSKRFSEFDLPIQKEAIAWLHKNNPEMYSSQVDTGVEMEDVESEIKSLPDEEKSGESQQKKLAEQQQADDDRVGNLLKKKIRLEKGGAWDAANPTGKDRPTAESDLLKCIRSIITETRCKNLEQHINSMNPDVFITLEAQVNAKRSSSEGPKFLTYAEMLFLDNSYAEICKLDPTLKLNTSQWFEYIVESERPVDGQEEKNINQLSSQDGAAVTVKENRIKSYYEKEAENLFPRLSGVGCRDRNVVQFANKKAHINRQNKTANSWDDMRLKKAETSPTIPSKRKADLKKIYNTLDEKLWGILEKCEYEYEELEENLNSIKLKLSSEDEGERQTKKSKVEENITDSLEESAEKLSAETDSLMDLSDWNSFDIPEEDTTKFIEDEIKQKEKELDLKKKELKTLIRIKNARANTYTCDFVATDDLDSASSCLPILLEFLNEEAKNNNCKWVAGWGKETVQPGYGGSGETVLVRTKVDVIATSPEPLQLDNTGAERCGWLVKAQNKTAWLNIIAVHAPAPNRICDDNSVRWLQTLTEVAKSLPYCVVMGDFNINKDVSEKHKKVKEWLSNYKFMLNNDMNDRTSVKARNTKNKDIWSHPYDKIMTLESQASVQLHREDKEWFKANQVRRYSDHTPRCAVVTFENNIQKETNETVWINKWQAVVKDAEGKESRKRKR